MARHISWLALVLSLATLPAFGQDTLPNSFAGWNTISENNFPPSQAGIFEDAPAAAAISEYGFWGAARRTYAHGAATFDVTLYHMKDPSGAYGEYLYLRAPDMRTADFGSVSSESRDRALILVGNFVLDISGQDLARNSGDLRALVVAVKPHAEQGLLPTVNNHLPAKQMIPRSDRYILGPRTLNQFLPLSSGDWLGFSNGAEAALAKYRVGGKDVTLLIADFPTHQMAAKELEDLKQKFNVNGSNPAGNSPALFAGQSFSLLSIVSGAASQAEAKTLLDQIHSDMELTWNEPTWQLTQPGWGPIIVGTIVGSGVVCLFALISGLAFGGFRLLIKLALPNRVFDRNDQIQILQLGLSSKPINAQDFYGLGRSTNQQ